MLVEDGTRIQWQLGHMLILHLLHINFLEEACDFFLVCTYTKSVCQRRQNESKGV